jgi:hypothetical protein
MGWAVSVVHFGEKRNAYRVLVGKPAGMRPLGIPGDMNRNTVLKWM